MNHEQFFNKIEKAVGSRRLPDCRAALHDCKKRKRGEIRLLYDWIVDPRFYRWVLECPDVDFGEGTESITVWIVNYGRVGHASDEHTRERSPTS